MKMTTIAYIVREGFANAFSNMRNFAASCGIVAASLAVIGIFMLAAQNIDRNASALGERPQIQVFCEYELGETATHEIETALRSLDGIREFVPVGKDEAYRRAMELLGDDAGMLEGIGPDFLPVSFIVRMEDPSMIDGFVAAAESIEGVDAVSYEERTITVIASVWRWAKAFGVLLAGMPMLLAAFIMTNAIKLAVYERRTEISVMRYIGATEQLIKWPFVVEGMVIGLLGAIVAFLFTGFGYALLERRIASAVAEWTGGLLSVVPIRDMAWQLIAAFSAIGLGVGAAGSLRSIGKYLKA